MYGLENDRKSVSKQYKTLDDLLSQDINSITEDEINFYINLESSDQIYGDNVTYEVNKRTLKVLCMYATDYMIFVHEHTTPLNPKTFKLQRAS